MHSAVTDISSQDSPDSAAMGKLNVLIAAGGTGGHVYPAIAIADALCEENPRAKILFVGTKTHIEWEAVPSAGYNITDIWISGFHRRFTLKNLLFPFKLVTSVIQSFGIIRNFNPDVVISCGGYVAGPVGWVAGQKNIPLVIQEQNSFPGVTNRMLGKRAQRVFTAFKEAEDFFPDSTVILSGNPVRAELTQTDEAKAHQVFGFKKSMPTLLILGGSGGARQINEAISTQLDKLHEKLGLQIIWQCGPRYYDKLREEVQPQNYEHLYLTDFLHDMPEAYATADLVISRAGAISCSELALTGTPSILVPSPNVAGDHQTKNARAMVDEGAAELVNDHDLTDTIAGMIEKIIFDKQKLEEMSQAAKTMAHPDASKEIASEILKMARIKQ